jgi:hypothetical protein
VPRNPLLSAPGSQETVLKCHHLMLEGVPLRPPPRKGCFSQTHHLHLVKASQTSSTVSWEEKEAHVCTADSPPLKPKAEVRERGTLHPSWGYPSPNPGSHTFFSKSSCKSSRGSFYCGFHLSETSLGSYSYNHFFLI